MNQSAIIINIKPLYEILNEINNNFSYKLVHLNAKEFDENFNKEDKQFDNSIFITTSDYIQNAFGALNIYNNPSVNTYCIYPVREKNSFLHCSIKHPQR